MCVMQRLECHGMAYDFACTSRDFRDKRASLHVTFILLWKFFLESSSVMCSRNFHEAVMTQDLSGDDGDDDVDDDDDGDGYPFVCWLLALLSVLKRVGFFAQIDAHKSLDPYAEHLWSLGTKVCLLWGRMHVNLWGRRMGKKIFFVFCFYFFLWCQLSVNIWVCLTHFMSLTCKGRNFLCHWSTSSVREKPYRQGSSRSWPYYHISTFGDYVAGGDQGKTEEDLSLSVSLSCWAWRQKQAAILTWVCLIHHIRGGWRNKWLSGTSLNMFWQTTGGPQPPTTERKFPRTMWGTCS